MLVLLQRLELMVQILFVNILIIEINSRADSWVVLQGSVFVQLPLTRGCAHNSNVYHAQSIIRE